MKKSLLIIVTVLSCQIQAISQIHFGPKAGFLLSKPKFDHFVENPYRSNLQPGFQLGGMMLIPVTPQFGLQTEILYQRKGKHLYGQDLYEHKAYSHYIDVPVLLNLTRGDKSFMWYVGAGGTISYWLGGGGKIINIPGDTPIEYSYVFDQNLAQPGGLLVTKANRYQIGLTLNAGTRFEIMDDRYFQIDFRYEMGHTYMAQQEEGFVNNQADNLYYSNQVASVSIAYLFTHFKKNQRLKSHTYDAKKRGN